MATDGTSEDGRESDGVREKPDMVRLNPDSVRDVATSRRERYNGVFTIRWKDLCREIIREYAKVHPLAQPGKPLGATRLRRLIVSVTSDSPDQITLSVDNLHDWLHRETGHLDDVKFSYVDEFVRTIQIDDPVYERIKPSIRDHKDRAVRQALSVIHSPMKPSNEVSKNDSNFLLGKTFSSKPLVHEFSSVPKSAPSESLSFSQVAIHVYDYKYNMFAVTALYSRDPFWKLKISDLSVLSNFVRYFGYVIPLKGTETANGPVFRGLMYLVREGAGGVHQLASTSISSFSINGITGGPMYVGWSPHILRPLVPLRAYASGGFVPPDLGIRVDEDPDSRDNFWITLGEVVMSESGNPDFVSEYLKNLTNGYVLW